MIDSYRWLPRSLAAYYQTMELPRRDTVPFVAVRKALSESTIACITTGGVHLKDDAPFDLERERREPAWGDPSYRTLSAEVETPDVAISHLHYEPEDALADLDVLFPVPLLRHLAAEEAIGAITPRHYSFMGFQLDPSTLLQDYLPDVIENLRQDETDAVILTPA